MPVHDKFKVLHLINTPTISGAENVVLTLANGMKNSEFESSICTLSTKGDLHTSAQQLGIKAYALGYKNIFSLPKVLMKLFLLLRKNKYHIINTHLFQASVIGTVLGKLAGIPVIIVTRHYTNYMYDYGNKIEQWLDKTTVMKATYVIAVAKMVQDVLCNVEQIPMNKTRVIYNGIDMNKFTVNALNKENTKKLLDVQHKLVITYIANMHIRKGHKFLIEAIVKLKMVYSHICVLIIGDGNIRFELENMTKQLDVESNFKFLGYRSDIPELLSVTDIYVHPSLEEGFPLTIIEAMAAGLPVIATNVGGIPEIIVNEENGILLSPGNTQALVDAISDLIEHPVKRKSLSEAGRQHVESNLTDGIMVKKYSEVYKRLLSADTKDGSNADAVVVKDFGKEWNKFDQRILNINELHDIFSAYFSIFPMDKLSNRSVGFDLGCGSGRWAKFIAPRVGTLHCIDPSREALTVAKRNLKDLNNCIFHEASVDTIPLEEGSADFGYSIGVLHHIPDTVFGLKLCAAKLKKDAPFLVYLYYAFDNRSFWYKALWKLSDMIRVIISRMPFKLKYILSQIIALSVYLPAARLILVLEMMGFRVDSLPLSFYRNKSFYIMRNDSLDRFGTTLEKRFTKEQISKIMKEAGLKNIRFSDSPPYWIAMGYKV